MANITSNDPRKAGLVAEFKKQTGGTKVTMMTEDKGGVVRANVLKAGKASGRRGYTTLGWFRTEVRTSAGLTIVRDTEREEKAARDIAAARAANSTEGA